MSTVVCVQCGGFQQRNYANLTPLQQRFTASWTNTFEFPARMISVTRRLRFGPKQRSLTAAIQPLEFVREYILAGKAPTLAQLHAWRTKIIQAQAELDELLSQMTGSDVARHALQQLAQADDQSLRLLTEQLNAGLRTSAWAWRWLKNQRLQYTMIEEQQQPLVADHYFIAWPDKLTPEVVCEMVKSGLTQDDTTLTPLPALLRGEYADEGMYLRPLEAGRPYVALLFAYDWFGDIDLSATHRILRLPLELALSIDVQRWERDTARTKTVNAHTRLYEQIFGRGKWRVKDPQSEAAYAAADYALPRIASQTLHQVRMAVMVQGRNVADLQANVRKVTSETAHWIRWDRYGGTQSELMKLFTTQHVSKILLPTVKRTNLSEAVAAKVPFGFIKTPSLHGTYWGTDIDQQVPVHYDPFEVAEGNDEGNAHLMFPGQSGSGKTTGFNTIGLRRAVHGDHIIYVDPVGKSRRLAEAVGIGTGATFYDVRDEESVNILDPMVDASHTNALRTQVGHVLRKLQTLLGQAHKEGAQLRFTPRVLNNFEVGAIERALADAAIYDLNGENLRGMTARTAPRIEDVVAVLRNMQAGRTRLADVSTLLADEIEARLLGVQEPLFNRPTTLRWDFDSAQVICYNFEHCDPLLMPLYFDMAFAGFNLYLRDTKQRRRGRTGKIRNSIFMVDEYGFLSRVPSMKAEVEMGTRTWRNYKGAMWTASQNASDYYGHPGEDNAAGRRTASNTLIKIYGRQEGQEAEIVANIHRSLLTERHLNFIRDAKPGEAVVLFDRRVHFLRMDLTNAEEAYFIRKEKA